MDDTSKNMESTSTDQTMGSGDRGDPVAIRGVMLRSVLLLALDRAGGASLTVRELGESIRSQGFTVAGRESKVVSDALRWEIGRGRVRRLGRGHYRIGELPRTTRWRCHQRVRAVHAGTAPPPHLHDPARAADPARRHALISATAAEMPARLFARRRNEIAYQPSFAESGTARGELVARRRNGNRCHPAPARRTTGHEARRRDDGTREAGAADP